MSLKNFNTYSIYFRDASPSDVKEAIDNEQAQIQKSKHNVILSAVALMILSMIATVLAYSYEQIAHPMVNIGTPFGLGYRSLLTLFLSLMLVAFTVWIMSNSIKARSKLVSMMNVTTAKLAKSSLLLDNIVDNIPVMLFVKDHRDLTIQVWNRAAEEITGIPKEQIIGKTGIESFPKEQMESTFQADRLVLESGRLYAIEEQLLNPRLGNRLVSTKKIPLFVDNGEIYILGISEDITQVRQLQQEQMLNQRFQAVGSLAAGIAHEINTPIQYVDTNLNYLKERLEKLFSKFVKEDNSTTIITDVPDDLVSPSLVANLKSAITEAIEGVGKVTSIVNAMQVFANPGSQHTESISINTLLEKTILVSRNIWKGSTEVVTKFGDALDSFQGFPAELSQAFLHLLINAVQAIESRYDFAGNGGKIFITTSFASGMIEVRISDNGSGIPADVLPRIFDPFFTTRPVDKGSGQGLTIAKSVVVNLHGGTINVQSEVNKGTEIIVRLPKEHKEHRYEVPIC